MPNETDAVEQTLKTLQEAFDYDESWHINSKKYKQFRGAVHELNSLYEQLSKVGDDGKPRALTAKDLTDLRRAYQKAQKAADQYLGGKTQENRRTELGRRRTAAAAQLKELIGKDLEALGQTNFRPGTTLKDALAHARKTVLVGGDLARTGNMMSTRLRVNAQGEDGFFTPSSVTPNPEEESRKILEDAVTRYPQFATSLKALGVSDDNECGPLSYCEISPEQRKKGIEAYADAWAKMSKDEKYGIYAMYFRSGAGIDPDSPVGKQLTEDMKDPEFLRILGRLAFQTSSVAKSGVTMRESGIPMGSNVEERNVAMSRMADVLGLNGLVAHAKTMSIRQGDQVTDGVLMDLAPGCDPDRLDRHKEFFGDVTYDTVAGKRSMADLQVLDYICGNTDRHDGNLFWQFAEKPDGTMEVTGLIGIDNDMSFGVYSGKEIAAQADPNKFCSPGAFGVMTRETAQAVMALDRDTIAVTLADLKLSPQEIEAVWERTQDIQRQLIADKDRVWQPGEVQHGAIHVIQDDAEWTKVSVDALADFHTVETVGRKQNNMFSRLRNFMGRVSRYPTSNQQDPVHFPLPPGAAERIERARQRREQMAAASGTPTVERPVPEKKPTTVKKLVEAQAQADGKSVPVETPSPVRSSGRKRSKSMSALESPTVPQ